MKLNKIQQHIYDQYRMTGKVWAECPRQSGKTTLLLFIAEQEIRCGNKVLIKSFNKHNVDRMNKLLQEKLGEDYNKLSDLIVDDEKDADVVLCDEIYYDGAIHCCDVKIVCLSTPLHETLRFTYDDLDLPKAELERFKEIEAMNKR